MVSETMHTSEVALFVETRGWLAFSFFFLFLEGLENKHFGMVNKTVPFVTILFWSCSTNTAPGNKPTNRYGYIFN